MFFVVVFVVVIVVVEGVGEVEGGEGEAEVVFYVFVLGGGVFDHPEAAGAAPVSGHAVLEADDAAEAADFGAEGLLGDGDEPAVAVGVAADVARGDVFCFGEEGGERVRVRDGADGVDCGAVDEILGG